MVAVIATKLGRASGGHVASDSRSLVRPVDCSEEFLEGMDAVADPGASVLDIVPSDPQNELEDIDLIRSVLGGSEDSFDLLFARYWKLVFAIAFKILRQRAEAEDIVQDVFLAIYQKSDQYDPGRASVRTWIAQFAYYKSLLRRRTLHAAACTNLDELHAFETGLCRFGSIEAAMEGAAFVEQCLAGLNARQRRILELVHFDGYTPAETAAIVKRTLANTRNLYYRGLNALRIQIRDHNLTSPRQQARLDGPLPEPGGKPLIFGRTCRP